MAEPPMKKVKHNASASLFNNPEFSDITVKCKHKTWKCHKNILANGSGFFLGLWRNQYKDSSANLISFDDEDPEVIELMLRGFYGETTNLGESFVYKTFLVADKYMARNLRKDTLTVMKHFLDGEVWRGKDFVNLCVEVFTDTVHAARNYDAQVALIQAAKSDRIGLLRDPGKIRSLATACPVLACEMLLEITEGPLRLKYALPVKCWNDKCPYYDKIWTYTDPIELEGLRGRYCVFCGLPGTMDVMTAQSIAKTPKAGLLPERN